MGMMGLSDEIQKYLTEKIKNKNNNTRLHTSQKIIIQFIFIAEGPME